MSRIGRLTAEMIEYLAGDVHEVEHLMKVYGYARTIGEAEGLDPRTQETLELASVVHDIGIHKALEKYGTDAGPYQEKEGPAEARRLLEKLDGALRVDDEMIDRVCFLVGHHHSYKGVDGLDWRILLEADFLVNARAKHLGAAAVRAARDGFFRTGTGRRFLELNLPV